MDFFESQLVFFCNFRNKTAILDSRQSEIFFLFSTSFIDQACSVEICLFMDLNFVSVHKKAKKTKKKLCQYPAILTSHLLNNALYN